jgi:D-glycero-alpha-D-manno-heptose-7-phosphate kinase
LVTAAIDKYVTVTVQPGNRIDTSPQHPYATAAGWSSRDLVTIESDLLPGSGLGGSSCLMTALLRARHSDLPVHELAMAAYHAERFGQIAAPIGYQDGFAAAFGGCIALEIDHAGRVATWPVALPADFERRLVLMNTGVQRPAADVLRKQEAATSTSLVSREAMESIANLGHEIYADIRDNQGQNFGPMLDRHWKYKRAVASVMSNPAIDAWYDLALDHGATGGKLIGAGSSGFFLFVVPPDRRYHFVDTMTAAGLTELPFQFTDQGARIIK